MSEETGRKGKALTFKGRMEKASLEEVKSVLGTLQTSELKDSYYDDDYKTISRSLASLQAVWLTRSEPEHRYHRGVTLFKIAVARVYNVLKNPSVKNIHKLKKTLKAIENMGMESSKFRASSGFSAFKHILSAIENSALKLKKGDELEQLSNLTIKQLQEKLEGMPYEDLPKNGHYLHSQIGTLQKLSKRLINETKLLDEWLQKTFRGYTRKSQLKLKNEQEKIKSALAYTYYAICNPTYANLKKLESIIGEQDDNEHVAFMVLFSVSAVVFAITAFMIGFFVLPLTFLALVGVTVPGCLSLMCIRFLVKKFNDDDKGIYGVLTDIKNALNSSPPEEENLFSKALEEAIKTKKETLETKLEESDQFTKKETQETKVEFEMPPPTSPQYVAPSAPSTHVGTVHSFHQTSSSHTEKEDKDRDVHGGDLKPDDESTDKGTFGKEGSR